MSPNLEKNVYNKRSRKGKKRASNYYNAQKVFSLSPSSALIPFLKPKGKPNSLWSSSSSYLAKHFKQFALSFLSVPPRAICSLPFVKQEKPPLLQALCLTKTKTPKKGILLLSSPFVLQEANLLFFSLFPKIPKWPTPSSFFFSSFIARGNV